MAINNKLRISRRNSKSAGRFFTLIASLFTLATSLSVTSCIEPPLKLPAEEVMVVLPIVITDLEVVWDIDANWHSRWYYGWDATDIKHWGQIAYPMPSSYEVRRYYLGQKPSVPHTTVDGFPLFTNSFTKAWSFGYHDMLIWSNIDSDDGSQVVLIDETDLNEVTASTTGTRGISSILSRGEEESPVVGLFNQPEIFYSAYPQNIFISRNYEDYDYYDEKKNVWVKRINCTLRPLVYIYLVQIIIYDNDGRITGVNGNNAVSGFASTTSVNTGQTGNKTCMVYYQSRMKKDLEAKGRRADIIGGKLTTYGLCDMPPYTRGQTAQYTGTRTDLKNILYFDLTFSNGTEKTMEADITSQCQAQSHGGVITIELNAKDIEMPQPEDKGDGSLFVPTVEDYDEVVWDITI